MALRYDSGNLERVQRTPQGGLRAPATLTRTGVFVYRQASGKVVREYRPPEEVFSPETMASLASAPVTLRHPPKMVDPRNFSRYSRGNLHGEPRQDGNKVVADLVIQDADAIDAVLDGIREVSCGYHCTTLDKPGVTPEGEPYDRIQTQIRYNHVALVKEGRAGSDVRLRLDANDQQIEGDMTEEEKAALVAQIESLQASLASLTKMLAGEKAATAEAVAASDENRARADQAEKALAALQTRLDEATKPEAIHALASRRMELVAAASKAGVDVRMDSMTDREIMIATLAKHTSETKLDSESDDYIRAAFRFASQGTISGEANARVAHATASGVRLDNAEAPKLTPRQAMIEAHRNAWKS